MRAARPSLRLAPVAAGPHSLGARRGGDGPHPEEQSHGAPSGEPEGQVGQVADRGACDAAARVEGGAVTQSNAPGDGARSSPSRAAARPGQQGRRRRQGRGLRRGQGRRRPRGPDRVSLRGQVQPAEHADRHRQPDGGARVHHPHLHPRQPVLQGGQNPDAGLAGHHRGRRLRQRPRPPGHRRRQVRRPHSHGPRRGQGARKEPPRHPGAGAGVGARRQADPPPPSSAHVRPQSVPARRWASA